VLLRHAADPFICFDGHYDCLVLLATENTDEDFFNGHEIHEPHKRELLIKPNWHSGNTGMPRQECLGFYNALFSWFPWISWL
jgi:hypothetical protein